MEQLITASIGICVDTKGNYFLQVITAAKYNNYLVKISQFDALKIAKADNIEIYGVQ